MIIVLYDTRHNQSTDYSSFCGNENKCRERPASYFSLSEASYRPLHVLIGKILVVQVSLSNTLTCTL